MNISLRKLATLCAVAGALFVGEASAAMKASEVLDGNIYSPSEDGRGISIMFAPRAAGGHTFFGALFTYDDNGEPTWLILFGPFLENQFESTTIEVDRVTGGAFGFPFNPANVDSVKVGTATVTLNTCSNISVSLDMDPNSGFSDVDLGDLQPVDGPSEFCVYKDAFSSCPAFSSPGPVDRTCVLNGVITQDITLTNETTWVLNGLVQIGNDNANSATITIEPGTTLIGAGGAADYLYINPGSKIYANGLPWAPIILTSNHDGFDPTDPTAPQSSDVGGLVVSGNAPTNACPDAPFNCLSEFNESLRFGGDDPHESSGELSYWQIRYAGYVFAPDKEVNSFTFQAVGDGTIVHHLQAYEGSDDGVEFFGGTVNMKYFIVTGGEDDGVDWDYGYSGKLQYGLVISGNLNKQGDFGIEGASLSDNHDALPRAIPKLANFTFIGDGAANGSKSSGILFKQGSGGLIYNTIVSGYPVGCIEWANSATYTAAGTPASPNEDVAAFNGVMLDCNNDFQDAAGSAYMVGDYFNSGAFENNSETDPMFETNPALGAPYMLKSNSPALQGGVTVDDPFFDSTYYRGGFDSVDWTAGWSYRPWGDN